MVICYYDECYTLKKGVTTWTLLGNLEFSNTASSSVVINNSLYAIGGVGNDYCSTIESISLDGTTTVESLTVNGELHPFEYNGIRYCISGQASVTINSTTSISIGGSSVANNGGSYTNKTWYYNGETFSEGPDLITGRMDDHAAGLLRDKDTNEEYIAVVGGRDKNFEIVDSLDSVELLKVGDNKWKSGIYLF